jgi:hypothetical protein
MKAADLRIVVTIRFGDQDDPELSLDKTYSFATLAEADAFVMGVDESNEWLGYQILEDDRAAHR